MKFNQILIIIIIIIIKLFSAKSDAVHVWFRDAKQLDCRCVFVGGAEHAEFQRRHVHGTASTDAGAAAASGAALPAAHLRLPYKFHREEE